jgi:hypothetical protein
MVPALYTIEYKPKPDAVEQSSTTNYLTNWSGIFL